MVVILSVLAATLVPRFGTSIEKSKISRAESELRTFRTALTKMFMDTNYYPRDVSPNLDPGLNDRNRIPASLRANWDGPYLERWPKDGHPWGGYYDYEYNSYGPMNYDGQGGNEVRITMRGGALTRKILTKIDTQMDDGNPNTGQIRHNNSNWLTYFVAEGPRW